MIDPAMKNRFQIGRWVTVKATVKFKYNARGQKYVLRSAGEFHAQICGAAERCTGTFVGGHTTRDPLYGNDESEPNCLEIDKVFHVWLVRRGMTNKSLMVLDADVEPWSLDPTLKLPWRFAKQPPLTQDVRDYMRREAQLAPRDAKGLFVKQSPPTKTDLQLRPGGDA